MVDLGDLRKRFCALFNDDDLARSTVEEMDRVIACLRVSNRDTLPLSNDEIAVILKGEG